VAEERASGDDDPVTSLGDLTSTQQSTASSTQPSAPPSTGPPAAGRATTPGWRDPRLWIGVVIVAVSVVAGSRLLAAADDSVPVWAVDADMATGDEVTGADLVARQVRFVDAADLDLYYPAEQALPGELRLRRDVGSGELLPRSATGTAEEAGVLQLPVTVEPAALPPGVGAGSVVDVYLRTDGRCPVCSEAALSEVTVVTVPGPDELTATQQVVLAVDQQGVDRWFDLLSRVQQPTVTILARG
jgi:hypothetical protein